MGLPPFRVEENGDRSEVRSRSLVLLSGGVDSSVVLYWAIRNYHEVSAVCLDYGQAHKRELAAARRMASSADVPFTVVRVLGLPSGKRGQGESAFIRGRNVMAVGIGASMVDTLGGDVLVGSLRTDPYPDCTPRFIADVSRAIASPPGAPRARVLAPLHDFEGKAAVIRLGLDMGVPLQRTWSCMLPRGRKPCRQCPSCVSRDKAFRTVVEQFRRDGVCIDEWIARAGSPSDRIPELPQGSHAPLVEQLLRLQGPLPWREGWRYEDPHGDTRFSTTGAPSRRVRRQFGADGETRYMRVASRCSIASPPEWELVVLADGTVAPATGSSDEAVRGLVNLIAGFGAP